MTRLTLSDIPTEFQYESDRVPLTNSYVRFAFGVCQELDILDKAPGLHLLQASWQLRFAFVAKGLAKNALPLPNAIGEEAQFIALAAFQLALVSCAAVLDIGAATLVGLAGSDLSKWTPDLRAVVENRLSMLPDEHARWARRTHLDSDRLFKVRNAVVHRHVPVSVFVGADEPYKLIVEGKSSPVQASIDEFLHLATDRLAALLLMLRST